MTGKEILENIQERKTIHDEILDNLTTKLVLNGFKNNRPHFTKKEDKFTICFMFHPGNKGQWSWIRYYYSFYVPEIHQDYFNNALKKNPRVQDCQYLGNQRDILMQHFKIPLNGDQYFLNKLFYQWELSSIPEYIEKWSASYNEEWLNQGKLLLNTDSLSFIQRYDINDSNSLKNIIYSDFDNAILPYFNSIKTYQDIIDAFKVINGVRPMIGEYAVLNYQINKNPEILIKARNELEKINIGEYRLMCNYINLTTASS